MRFTFSLDWLNIPIHIHLEEECPMQTAVCSSLEQAFNDEIQMEMNKLHSRVQNSSSVLQDDE